MKLTKQEQLMLNRLEKHINAKGVSNDFLVQLIELSGQYLNLKTIPKKRQNKI